MASWLNSGFSRVQCKIKCLKNLEKIFEWCCRRTHCCACAAACIRYLNCFFPFIKNRACNMQSRISFRILELIWFHISPVYWAFIVRRQWNIISFYWFFAPWGSPIWARILFWSEWIIWYFMHVNFNCSCMLSTSRLIFLSSFHCIAVWDDDDKKNKLTQWNVYIVAAVFCWFRHSWTALAIYQHYHYWNSNMLSIHMNLTL